MAYVDYKTVKTYTDIQQVASWLGIELKNNRSYCPINQGDPRELVITPDKQLAHCFGCKTGLIPFLSKRGGDSIWLTSHVKQIPLQEAAREMQRHFHGYVPDKRGLPPGGLDYLEHEHEAVQALGLSAAKAEELGIGYAARGTMTRRILFPLRDKHGTLLGYLGVAPGSNLKLPKGLLE